MGDYNFYTLLYIDDENKSLSQNGVEGDFEKQMLIFLKCAENLQHSLKFFSDSELMVLTNNSSFIQQRSTTLKCIDIPFSFDIPTDINFFASLHKIDVFRWFYENRFSEYSFLIDNDIMCVNPMPQNLKNCITNNIPVYYDITGQVFPAYGRDVIISDKNKILNINSSIGLWAGGEFIGGRGSFYKQLYNKILDISGVYFSGYKSMHHQGDEALVSPAIEYLLRNNIYIANAGDFGAIGRYWSVKTLHTQEMWESFEKDFLIHLPADKIFLSKLTAIDNTLVDKYRIYLKQKGINIGQSFFRKNFPFLVRKALSGVISRTKKKFRKS